MIVEINSNSIDGQTRPLHKCTFDFSRNEWTFGSGSLLCQGFRRRRKEMALDVKFIIRVMTYDDSYNLFSD